MRLTWPDRPLPRDLYGLGHPTLYVTVTTPRDQAQLHRELARLGYVPEIEDEGADVHCWRFEHPDGPR